MSNNNTGIVTKGLAFVGVAALLVGAGNAVVNAIIANVAVSAGNPRLDFNTPAIDPLNPNEVFVRVDLPITVTNDNVFPLGVNSFEGVIKYGNITLTTIGLPYGIWVPAGGTITVNVDVDIPLRRVYDDLAIAIANGNILNTLLNKITLSGTVHVVGKGTGVSIPLTDIAIPIV
jgi:LEA14-like dessication related protein